MLFYFKNLIAIRAGDICFVVTPIMSCNDNLKILYSVILFIFNRPKRIFSALMVNKFPSMETAAKVLSHYQAMFLGIALRIYHRVKEIGRRNPNQNITMRGNNPSTFPTRVTRTTWLRAPATAFLTMQMFWNSTFQYRPAFLATANAGVPDILVKSSASYINGLWVYFFGSSYLTKFQHTYIIPYNQKVRKVVYY